MRASLLGLAPQEAYCSGTVSSRRYRFLCIALIRARSVSAAGCGTQKGRRSPHGISAYWDAAEIVGAGWQGLGRRLWHISETRQSTN